MWASLALLIFLGLASQAWAQVSVPDVQKVTVWGETKVTSDPSADKRSALMTARRAAVEQVVGAYVSSTTLVENFQLVDDRIYSKAAGFVNGYRILKEDRDDTQRVQIEAQVSTLPITDILRGAGLLRAWRVGILLSPSHAELTAMLSYYSRSQLMEITRRIETNLGRGLVDAGFKVVDPKQLGRLRRELERTSKIPLNAVSGMDLLVTGSVSVAARRSDGSLHQAICQIHVKALRADTGEIIYQHNLGNTFDGTTLLVNYDVASEYANTLGNGYLADGTPDLRTFGGGVSAALDKAIHLASMMAADEVVAQISRLPAAVSSRIALELHGLDFSQLMEFEEGVKGIQGVANVSVEEFSTGAQNLEVEYDGDAMMFARILNKSDLNRKLGLRIKSVTKNKITIRAR